ncbi:MAG TPA: hypothetical protein VNG33_12895, partial [Polyangiaceae bacterium]|nr:hypothetical protein [Polyangiaceae bacterium]
MSKQFQIPSIAAGAGLRAAAEPFALASATREMGSIARFVARASVAWCTLCALSRAEQPPAEAPPSRAQCLGFHEQAQDARLAGQLLSARRLLRECSAAACPSLVSRDCVGWLSELEQQVPSVIFRAVKDGEDVVTLKVSEGQKLLTDSLTG